MSAEHNRRLLEETLRLVDGRNLGILKEIKIMLNTIFGQDYNQIVKLDLIDQIDYRSYTERSFYSFLEQNLKDYRRYQVILYFPEIIISNNEGKSHTIKDIYVSFYLNCMVRLDGDLLGMRSTFTRHEWVSDYAHSHLPGHCTTFSEFCTGTGEINQVMAMLRASYDPINFEMFCHHIRIFLGYESIEGTPFRYIRNIGHRSYAVRVFNADQNGMILEYIYKKFIQDTEIPDIQNLLRVTINEKPQVEATDEMERWLADFLIRLKQIAPSERSPLRNVAETELIVYKVGLDDYTTILSESTRTEEPERELLNFKGETRRLKILLNQDVENQRTFYANPWITRYICDSLARSITKNGVGFTGAAQRSNHTDQRQVATADPLPVLSGASR